MNTFLTVVTYFLVAATLQNLVLTTGLGASSMLKILRRPRSFLSFGGFLLFFTVATAALFYPIDQALPITRIWLMLRPFFIIVLACVLYGLTALFTKLRFPNWYRRNRQMLPLAALNNLGIGVVLATNYQASLTFAPAMALAAGAAVGFVGLSAITAEGVSRVDNPDTPAAFRGLPVTLVYLGLLALALMGFSPVVNLV